MITLKRINYLAAMFIAAALLGLPSIAPVHMQPNLEPTPGGGSNLPQSLGTNFSDLTFSTSSTGPIMWYFPVGTQEIFARWNYQHVPQGTTLRRQWYRNDQLFLEKSEPWNTAAWGTDGTLNQISIYDRPNGLQPGNYYVLISLMSNGPIAQISNIFTIADYPVQAPPPNSNPAFTGLTVSDSAAGADRTTFPAGTPSVNIRWNYANIPMGTILQRDWYLNGVLFRSVQETWSTYWGSSGRLTHIALYDYQNGLTPGNYRVVVFLRDIPSVQAETAFSIGGVNGNAPQLFSNLTFSTSPGGPAMAIFPRGIKQVFARWDYHFVPTNTIVVRRWYRYGVLFLEKSEAWTHGEQGTVNDVSIYDFDSGLLPGDYYVEISLMGIPNSIQKGYFTIS